MSIKLRLILSSPVSGNTSLAALLVASPAPHSAHRGIQSKAVPVFTLCTRLSTPHTQQVTGYNSSQFTIHTPVHQSTTGTRLVAVDYPGAEATNGCALAEVRLCVSMHGRRPRTELVFSFAPKRRPPAYRDPGQVPPVLPEEHHHSSPSRYSRHLPIWRQTLWSALSSFSDSCSFVFL